MVLAYILVLSLCASQAMAANSTVNLPDGDESTVIAAPLPLPPSSPTRAARLASPCSSPVKVGSAPGTPTKTPTKPPAKPSPGRSPWPHKVTPGKPGTDRGSGFVVRTSRTEISRRYLEALSSSSSDDSDSASPSASSSPASSGKSTPVPSINMSDVVKATILANCASYRIKHDDLIEEIEEILAINSGTAFQLDSLYVPENTFWNRTLVAIDNRVITKMPYRRLLGVMHDRENGISTSPSFNGKNKKNVADHTFSYEFFCRILTSPESRVFKAMYKADLSAAKDGSMCVAYEVLELHYPTELTYIKSPHSPIGRATDDEVVLDYGERTSVIAFSQSPAALLTAFASAEPRDMDDGRELPFIKNRFNWIFHAQHQKGVVPELVPVQVKVDITPDCFGRVCVELEVVDLAD